MTSARVREEDDVQMTERVRFTSPVSETVFDTLTYNHDDDDDDDDDDNINKQ